MDSRLEHVDFDSLLQCLSVGRLLQVFASILLERRVIFIADKLRCRLFQKTQLRDLNRTRPTDPLTHVEPLTH